MSKDHSPVSGEEIYEAVDDIVLPFYLEASQVSGRAVKLGKAANDILTGHDYPEPVSRLLAEAMALTAMLGASLKHKGRLIFQTQTNGPVSMLVVDFTMPDILRACATFDEKKLADLEEASEGSQARLLGTGHMAMTLDQGGEKDRHQGIVSLEGEGLKEAAEHYFEQSEQMETFVHLAAGKLYAHNKARSEEEAGTKDEWRVGGLMIQKVAAEGGKPLKHDRQDEDYAQPAGSASSDEDWKRARLLAETIEDHELLDPSLPLERLLYRLFHEERVRTYPARKLKAQCTCSRERILSVLRQFTTAELREMKTKDNKIEVTCEFCSSCYTYDPEETGKKI